MTARVALMGAVAGAALMGGASAASALDEITVAYFLEWPMPFEYAKAEGLYEQALGVRINWRSFDTGTAMSAAMASGDVQIAVSQGIPPVVVATSAGQDLQILDVAVSYSDNDNCVVRSDLEIGPENASELAGKTIAVPIGTAPHYGLLKQLEHFGIDPASVNILDMAPADSAPAFAQGAIDVACGWGGPLRRMLEHGNVLLTGAEKEELGILVFDATTSPASFVAEHPDLVAAFLKVTAEANALWSDPARQAELIPVIAQDSGLDEAAAAETLATFVFPSVEEQLTEKWLGGGVQDYMKGVAEIFVATGNLPAALDSYDAVVDTGPLTTAAGL